ncbi:hypothetical protein SCMU_29730 [Sinomonas cyclohexanicum]|uniref:Uncharacterized protein n=1 Tax=Sinomonas cyclohexanicum TaxID=322009 RepID=A0ABM7PXU4_SINCY|nr:hypothetical protein SCMU_29730 [Corynebacterium cyclohexanicum]
MYGFLTSVPSIPCEKGMGGPTANTQLYAGWARKLNPPMLHGRDASRGGAYSSYSPAGRSRFTTGVCKFHHEPYVRAACHARRPGVSRPGARGAGEICTRPW